MEAGHSSWQAGRQVACDAAVLLSVRAPAACNGGDCFGRSARRDGAYVCYESRMTACVVGLCICIYTYIYITLSRRLSVAFLLVYEGDESRRTRRGQGRPELKNGIAANHTRTHTHTRYSLQARLGLHKHIHTRYSLHPAAGPYIGRWVAHLWECLKRKDSYGCPGVASVSSPAVAVRNCLPQAKHPQNRHNLPLKPEAHNNVHEYGATMPYYSLRSQ